VRRGFDKESASRAGSYSEGSLGLAVQWLEDGVIDRATELTQRLEKILTGGGVSELPEFLKTSAEAYAAKQLERDERASKDQLTREGMVLYLKLVAQFFRRWMVQIEDDPDQLERACAAIDAVVRAEGYVDSNVNIPLVLQQFAVALEGAVH
jgi:hypothetical protein